MRSLPLLGIAVAVAAQTLACGSPQGLVLLDVTSTVEFNGVRLTVRANDAREVSYENVHLQDQTAFQIGMYLPSDIHGTVTLTGEVHEGDCLRGTGTSTAMGIVPARPRRLRSGHRAGHGRLRAGRGRPRRRGRRGAGQAAPGPGEAAARSPKSAALAVAVDAAGAGRRRHGRRSGGDAGGGDMADARAVVPRDRLASVGAAGWRSRWDGGRGGMAAAAGTGGVAGAGGPGGMSGKGGTPGAGGGVGGAGGQVSPPPTSIQIVAQCQTERRTR